MRQVVVTALLLTTALAQADAPSTGNEPWYRESTPQAREQALALYLQAVEQHRQLLRAQARVLYEQALELWDNPTIRWNLALMLDDMGEYLHAHQQLEGTLRWGTALGEERLRKVHDRLAALEKRLARIEADAAEPDADVKLDGEEWFRGPGRRSALVAPGTHYVGATKPGYTVAAVSTTLAAGERYRATLRMIADSPAEVRRWSVWMPWRVVAAGLVLSTVGAGLEWRLSVNRDAATQALTLACGASPSCPPTHSSANDRAATYSKLALGGLVAGGVVTVLGLALASFNRPTAQRSEAPRSSVEIVPELSARETGVSAQIRF